MKTKKGIKLVVSTQDMRRILDQLGTEYSKKIIKDAIRKKIIRLAPDKYEGWEWR